MDHETALATIKNNIEQAGFHLYVVMGGAIPRYAYTIGLRESLGTELIMAGAYYYSADEIGRIVKTVSTCLWTDGPPRQVAGPGDLGTFVLQGAHESWTRSLMLGALDYYKVDDVAALQIVPDQQHTTMDVPNMNAEWRVETAQAWKWMHASWPYVVPRNSTVMTNLDALRGLPVTEVTRWEEGYWEMFAGRGPAVSQDAARVVPLGCLLTADASLAPALDLELGKGIWRNSGDDDWHLWE